MNSEAKCPACDSNRTRVIQIDTTTYEYLFECLNCKVHWMKPLEKLYKEDKNEET